MDEYVRNTTARAFAVVASALGIPALLPFLKAVCKSKKSWQARHTGRRSSNSVSSFNQSDFRNKNRSTDCHPDGLCRFASLESFGGHC